MVACQVANSGAKVTSNVILLFSVFISRINLIQRLQWLQMSCLGVFHWRVHVRLLIKGYQVLRARHSCVSWHKKLHRRKQVPSFPAGSAQKKQGWEIDSEWKMPYNYWSGLTWLHNITLNTNSGAANGSLSKSRSKTVNPGNNL